VAGAADRASCLLGAFLNDSLTRVCRCR
jgi:hypothetical protein